MPLTGISWQHRLSAYQLRTGAEAPMAFAKKPPLPVSSSGRHGALFTKILSVTYARIAEDIIAFLFEERIGC